MKSQKNLIRKNTQKGNSSKRPVSTTPALLRNFLIFFLTVAIVVLTQQVKRSVKAAEPGSCEKPKTYSDFVLCGHSADELIDKYHNDINKFFNENIKRMVAAMKENEGKSKELTILFKPPEYQKENGVPTIRQSCDSVPKNLSTYCLAISGTRKYFEFRDALLVARSAAEQAAGNVSARLQSGAITKNGDISDAQQNMQNLGQLIDKINREADLSRQALDQALSAYNEMQYALPLHTKYMEVVKSLEKYRDKVAGIRRTIEQFPSTFLDVTTTQCT